jgi:hypothetical protein
MWESGSKFVYRGGRVLFAGHRTMEVQSRARLPGNPRSEKWLGMEWEAVGRSRDIKARVQM